MIANYIIDNNDGTFTGPLTMRSAWAGRTDWHLQTDEYRRQFGWYPCEIENEGYNPALETRTGPVITIKNNVAKAVYTITPRSVEDIQDAITIERDRRINGGFTFNDIRFQTDPQSRQNISDVVQLADEDATFNWIAEDNSLITMDAQTLIEFSKAVAQEKQRLTLKAREIKNLDPIPADCFDDHLWNAS